MLYFDDASNQYQPTAQFAPLLLGTEYDNDAAAAIGGVAVGSYYPVSATNTYSMQQGAIKKRIL